jgi:hypothetical protein
MGNKAVEDVFVGGGFFKMRRAISFTSMTFGTESLFACALDEYTGMMKRKQQNSAIL